MNKLQELKEYQMELVNNISWSEENMEELQQDKNLADLYIFELNELEKVSKEIEFVTELEQLGYHENKIVELYNAKFPQEITIFEEITQILGKNGDKKEITLFSNARILIEKFDNKGKIIYSFFKNLDTKTIKFLKINGFSNKIYSVKVGV